ncbi:hypothetical protein PG995_011028 [Apiospora arundinis]
MGAEKYWYPDVIYNTSRGLWVCCGDHGKQGPDCTLQTRDTFNLAPPQDLLASGYFKVPATGFKFATETQTSSATALTTTATSVSSSATITTTAASASSTSSDRLGRGDSSSSSLATGTAVGIGVGAGLAVVGVAGLATWYAKRKRRRIRQRPVPESRHHLNPQKSVYNASGQLQERPVKSELNGQNLPPRELPA